MASDNSESGDEGLLQCVTEDHTARINCFYQRLYCEWNFLKSAEDEVEATGRRVKLSKAEQRATPYPDSVSAKTLLFLLNEDVDEASVVTAMEELREILCVPEPEKMDHQELLELFLARLTEWQQMHDYHTWLSDFVFF